MDKISQSFRQLLATGPLATVVTVDPDGTPHVTLSWAGFDGDEIVMATFFNLEQRKLSNLRRDPQGGPLLPSQGAFGPGALAVRGRAGAA